MPFRPLVVCSGRCGSLSKEGCDFDPEKIRDDQLYLPINGLPKQIHSFLLKRL